MVRMALLFLVFIGSAVPSGAAEAAMPQLVRFESAAMPPTPLRKRLARKRDETLVIEPGELIQGHLFRPQGAGRYPAVVVLHGCAGQSREVDGAWSQRFVSWGYVALAVDSFGPRGIKDTCSTISHDRPMDAYGALNYLTRQPFVDPDRIVVLGFSAGGIAVLSAVAVDGIETLFERKFRAAVAFYPYCGLFSGDMSVPTLILVGELDNWTPAEGCRKMVAQQSGTGDSVDLIVYPHAYHNFDNAALRTGINLFGHWLEYNEAAAERSIEDVRRFLLEVMGK